MRERRSLRILGKRFPIKWWDDIPGSMGAAQSDELKVFLSRNYPAEEKCSTVLHEVLEIYNSKLEWHLTHEQICLAEELLYAFLADNGVNLKPLIEEK
ncbi:MAG TPA: hypothetical protein VLH60_01110 [Sedimentisphaerales bacterium]|nr:hypothetical protein [Sedimentisphaerales bacterium]